MAARHEIPTHLAVEDRVLGGLTMPQLLVLLAGGSAGYAVWQDAAFLPTSVRLALAGAAMVGSTAAAMVRPHGQSLLTWALVVLRYRALPRVCLWRPDSTPPADAIGRGMLPVAPALAWPDGGVARPSGRVVGR